MVRLMVRPVFPAILATVFSATLCLGDVISYPGATLTAAEDINNDGTIVGFYDLSGTTHGFELSNGIFSTIDYPGATATFVKGINATGQIVGDMVLGGADMGFLFSGGMYTPIGVPDADSTSASGINTSGEIVGTYTASGVSHGFVLDGGSYTPFDVPGATGTSLDGVNDAGAVAGFYDISGANFGFFSNESLTSINYPGAIATFGNSINDAGVVSGYYFDSSGVAHGFIDMGGVVGRFDFPGADDTFAKATNEHSQTVGFWDFNGTTRGFVAVPEPNFALVLGGFGLCLILGWMRAPGSSSG